MFLKSELDKQNGSKKTRKNLENWKNLFGNTLHRSDKMQVAYDVDQEKFKKLVSEGVPSKFRWEAWKTLLGMQEMVSQEEYDNLLSKTKEINEETDPVMRQIIVDVDRSFTWHPYFDKNLSKSGLK